LQLEVEIPLDFTVVIFFLLEMRHKTNDVNDNRQMIYRCIV